MHYRLKRVLFLFMNFFKNNGAKILCALVYLLLGYIIYALIYKFLPQEINNIVNIISILSAYTSVYALGIMLYQMISVERTTNETKNRINNVLIISDYAKLIEIARFIQEDIKNGKYEVALYKMQHLKDAILINKHRCNDGLTYFSNHISILGVHISS